MARDHIIFEFDKFSKRFCQNLDRSANNFGLKPIKQCILSPFAYFDVCIYPVVDLVLNARIPQDLCIY